MLVFVYGLFHLLIINDNNIEYYIKFDDIVLKYEILINYLRINTCGGFEESQICLNTKTGPTYVHISSLSATITIHNMYFFLAKIYLIWNLVTMENK